MTRPVRTLLQFGRQRFQAQIGVTAVLHTWGQKLGGHYHLHCIVSGGGWAENGSGWVSSGPHYLFPIQALSKVFGGKFRAGLQALYAQGKLEFHGEVATLARPTAWTAFGQMLQRQKWMVYAKRPFAGTEQVLAYLSRYTHRAAISPRRLLMLTETAVTFSYKDYADDHRRKTLDAGAAGVCAPLWFAPAAGTVRENPALWTAGAIAKDRNGLPGSAPRWAFRRVPVPTQPTVATHAESLPRCPLLRSAGLDLDRRSPRFTCRHTPVPIIDTSWKRCDRRPSIVSKANGLFCCPHDPFAFHTTPVFGKAMATPPTRGRPLAFVSQLPTPCARIGTFPHGRHDVRCGSRVRRGLLSHVVPSRRFSGLSPTAVYPS